MKRITKEPKKNSAEKGNVIKESKPQKQAAGKKEDVQRLIHLLQVHQIELEHQNQELRITQEELEISRNKYVNLFDFSPIPYFTLDKDSKILELNISASKMLEMDRNKIMGKSFTTYIQLDGKYIYNSFLNAVFSSPEKQSCELKVANRGKATYHVLLEGLLINDALDPVPKCQVALIDLTEYKKVEDSLKESTEKFKLLNATKDKLFSIIAHDLRSPFQSLLYASQLLATEIEKLSHEEILMFSKGLNDNINNIYVLLDNLLNWSLMQRDMLEYTPVNVNIHDCINTTIEIFKQNALQKKILISNNVDPGVIVLADVNMLNSVVQNLILNAVKFTDTEGRIVISSKKKNNYVEVSVQDSGVGIQSEDLAQLFSSRTMHSTHGTAGEKGSGLGLSLCKEYIERSNGKIWVESELGKGSRFIFTLPATV